MLAKDWRGGFQRLGQTRIDGDAPLGIKDGGRKRLGEPGRAALHEQAHPRIEGAGHHRWQKPGAWNEIEPKVNHRRDTRRCGRRPLPAERLDLSFGTVQQDRNVARRPVHMGLGHLHHETGSDCCIEGVAAGLQYS